MGLLIKLPFKHFFLSAFACFVMSGSLAAQSLDNVTRRKMNFAVLNALDDYQLATAINSRSDKYRFIQLFESPEALIFCDLFNSGESYKTKVTVQDYADFLMNKCENVNADITDVRKGNFFYDSELAWHCKVTLDKTLTYNDMNGVLFPPFAGSLSPFRLEVDLVYDENSGRMKIHSIDCLNPDGFVPMTDYYIVQRNKERKDSLRDSRVTIKRQPLEFNSFGQAFANKGRIEYWDYDVKVDKKLIAEDDPYEMIILNYKRKNFRIKAHYGMTYNSRYDIRSASNFTKKESAGKEAGVDLGFSFSASKGFRFGLFTGAAASLSTMNLAMDNIVYEYKTNDGAGQEYVRNYNIKSAAQDVKFMDVAVPLYMNLNFRIARGVSLYFDLGGRAYFNLMADVSPMTLSGIVISKYTTHTKSETFDVSTNEFLSPKAFEREKMDYSVFGNAGLEIAIVRNSIYLLASAGYEYGLTWTYSSAENQFYGNSQYPYVYYAPYGKDVVFRPFADCMSFRIECIWLNFGLMLKL